MLRTHLEHRRPASRVVVNGRFLTRRITGVERYAGELLKELDKVAEPGWIEVVVPAGATDLPVYDNIVVTRTGRLSGQLWEQLALPLYARRRHAITLNLCNTAPLVNPGIVCIHDMKVNAFPQFFSWRFRLWYKLLFFNATKRAPALITVSNFSKTEILRYYRVEEASIAVIPNAWQHFEAIGADERALEKYQLTPGEYYFALSSLEPNKNVTWVAEVAARHPETVFGVAGSVNAAVFKAGPGALVAENVKLLGYVSDGEAKTLMRECKAFLFPTFYEGFGLPPLEALSAGARIVVSDTPCMHEVFGDTAAYIDPYCYDVSLDSLGGTPPMASDSPLEKYTWASSARSLHALLRDSLRR